MKIFAMILVAATLVACHKEDKSDANALATPGMVVAKQPPIPSRNGPFGLAPGMTVAELEKLDFKTFKRPGFFTGTPPKPMESASEFYVQATPKAGLCRIMAVVAVNVVNNSGDQIKTQVDNLAETLQTKYGKHSSKIVYASESYERNPEHWMLGLTEEDAVYAYVWAAGKTEQILPDTLQSIEVSASANTLHSGFAVIRYTYANAKDCDAEEKQSTATNL